MKPLGITVLTVNPGPIKTKFFETADKTGHYLENVKNIVLSPELVAGKIVRAIGTRKQELNLLYFFEIASHLYNMFPRLGDFVTVNFFNKK